MVLTPADLLAGVGRGGPTSQDKFIGDNDPDYRELPPIDDGIEENEQQDDNELSVDENIGEEEVADLLMRQKK